MHKDAFTAGQRATLFTGIIASIPGATMDESNSNPVANLHLEQFEGEGRIWFAYDEHTHRVEVHGLWPKLKLQGDVTTISPRDVLGYGETNAYKCVTVSAAKNPVQIAAEIARRFLPGYTAVLAKCLEYRRQREAFFARTSDLTADLGNLIGRAPEIGRSRETGYISLKCSGTIYGDVEVRGECVSFNVKHANPEQARKLAAFLATL